jgi:hypothetical protein
MSRVVQMFLDDIKTLTAGRDRFKARAEAADRVKHGMEDKP